MTSTPGSNEVPALRRGKYLSVTTYKRDGTAVPTPVWYALADGEVVFWTGAGSGKVKRIRNDGRVQVAVCNVRGRIAPGADTFTGTARLLDEAGKNAARRVLARKYLLVRLTELGRKLMRKGPRPDQVGVAITF